LKDGTICPTLKRNEVSKILRLQRVTADEQRILNLTPIEGKFRTIAIDPAWEYNWLSLAARAKAGLCDAAAQLRARDIKHEAECLRPRNRWDNVLYYMVMAANVYGRCP
jgi:hypothetical protein